MREMAADMGMTILELSHSAQDSDDIDQEIDARTVRLAEDSDHFVMDARLGWHFIPHSFKVFLEVRPEVAAHRIYAASRGAEHENVTLDDTRKAIEARTVSEQKRYMDYYGLDYGDHSQYDLVVDTSERTIDQVTSLILAEIEGQGSSSGDV